MAVITSEDRQIARKVLSSINYISRVGGSDSTVAGNATITLLAAAIKALPFNGVAVPEVLDKIARGLKLGVTIGAYSETHSQTTIAGLRDLVLAGIIPEVSSSYDAELPE